MNDYEWIDDCFRIEKSSWDTWKSFTKNEEIILTSLTKETCVDTTRFYLKRKQDNYMDIKL
jgi:hypothetical protein